MRRIAIASLTALALSLAGPATVALANPPGMPDGYIKRVGGGGGFRGFDIINSTGANQTVRARMPEDGGRGFKTKVRNRGKDPDTITVKGCDGNQNFAVRYFDSDLNGISGAVKNGTYEIEDVPVDTNVEAVFVAILARPGGNPGDMISCRLRFESTNLPPVHDVVRAKAKIV